MSRVLSSLLSIRENGLVFSLLGSDCSVSACAVVQLYLAITGKKSEWQIYSSGVVCLVQDKQLHSTFIRLFSVKRAKLLWEQELYTPFQYLTPRPFFHTFPSDECWAGLNFCDEDEASRFHKVVQSCISSTKARPAFVRTHSLDSAPGWLIRKNLNACFSLTRSASIKAPVLEETQSMSLAERKGPLPPVPSTADAAYPEMPVKETQSIPLPPSYTASNLHMNPAAVKKSGSFSPGGNYCYTVERQQRKLRFTDEI